MMYRSWIPWLLLLVLVGCSRHIATMPELTVDFQQPAPAPQLGADVLELRLVYRNQPLTAAAVMVEGTMTHAGMPPVSAVATEIAPGQYQMPWDWTMSGDWVLTALITLPDGQTVERELPLITVEETQP